VNVDFKAKLKDQLTYLCTSCASYDAGNKQEAVRIALLAIRVLLHDTRSSKSLLTHLGAKQRINLSSSVEGVPHPGAVFAVSMVRTTILGSGETTYSAPLDAKYLLPMAVDDWWSQVVYILGKVRCSRKDIVLGAANKDGGAHVDTALSPDYATLATTGERGWWHYSPTNDPNNMQPVKNVHLVYLRQMGFEIMNSPELLALTI
jgi:hypothetical protein